MNALKSNCTVPWVVTEKYSTIHVCWTLGLPTLSSKHHIYDKTETERWLYMVNNKTGDISFIWKKLI